ncbi:MAG: hypothetical protein AB7H97_09110 [Pseudobdellovibrionaceae bacterium]
MKKVTKVLMALLVSAMAVGTTGCTGEEIQASAILLGAAAIGGAVIASGARCEGGYVEKCSSYYSRRGHYGHSCRREYDSCARLTTDHSRNRIHAAGGTKQAPAQSLSMQAALVAEKHKMSFEAAETVIAVIEAAKKGDLSQVQNVGLTEKDLNTLAHGWQLSDRTVDRISQTLDMELNATHKMVDAIESKFKNPLERSRNNGFAEM